MRQVFDARRIGILVILFSLVSCNDDEVAESNTMSNLIGEWQRSDVSETFEYKLYFDGDNTGYSTQREENSEGQALSNASSFNWTVTTNQLTFDYNGDIETSSFSINDDGALLLPAITNLFFVQIH